MAYFTAPDNWLVVTGGTGSDTSGPRILGLHPEEDMSLWIGFLSPVEPKSLEEAEAYVIDLGRGLVDEAEVQRTEDGRLGNLPARYYLGRGLREGAPVGFGVVIAALPDSRAVIGIVVGEYGARDVYREPIDAILASLKPVALP